MVKASLKSGVPAPKKVATKTVVETPPADPSDMVGNSEGAAEAVPTSAVATVPKTSTAVARNLSNAEAGFDGEWSGDDLKFPQLKLVQGNGPLSLEHDLGTLLYADEQLLPPPSKAADAVNGVVRFVPVSIHKQFREKLSEDAVKAGEMPRIAASVAEVEELGGTTRWIGDTQPDNYWEPAARNLFLLELPDKSEHPAFCLALDGKSYAVAVYYSNGGGFRDSSKIIFNTAQTSLLSPVLGPDGQPAKDSFGRIQKRIMLYKCFWTICFKQKQAGNFNPWRPVVKLLSKEETGPEVRAYCHQLLHGAPAAE